MFSILAWTGKSEWLFAVAVLQFYIAAAFATVAVTIFIALLVDRTYSRPRNMRFWHSSKANKYKRTTLAASSGALVDGLGGDWGLFFGYNCTDGIRGLACYG